MSSRSGQGRQQRRKILNLMCKSSFWFAGLAVMVVIAAGTSFSRYPPTARTPFRSKFPHPTSRCDPPCHDPGSESRRTLLPMPPHTEQAKWFVDEVHPHDAQLKAYLRGAFPSVRDVDDLVQESYLRIWRVRAEGPIRSARAFLFTVARRLAIDGTRRQIASPVDAVEDLARLPVADETADVAGAVEQRERVLVLGDAIGQLPDRCREVFLLHKIQGLSRRETGERLGLAEKTIEVQTARAMDRCGEYLRRRGVTGLFSHERC